MVDPTYSIQPHEYYSGSVISVEEEKYKHPKNREGTPVVKLLSYCDFPRGDVQKQKPPRPDKEGPPYPFIDNEFDNMNVKVDNIDNRFDNMNVKIDNIDNMNVKRT
ncbi:hypothetical protein J6590_079042 [Homalodisca vitripennis]|nr:hypothetical protein J6590_079042 [Homalodisca vitripennis]